MLFSFQVGERFVGLGDLRLRSRRRRRGRGRNGLGRWGKA
jgi:hypothetical protein